MSFMRVQDKVVMMSGQIILVMQLAMAVWPYVEQNQQRREKVVV